MNLMYQTQAKLLSLGSLNVRIVQRLDFLLYSELLMIELLTLSVGGDAHESCLIQ